MAGKADLVEHLVDQFGDLTKKQAGEIVEEVFDCITDYLSDDERVQVPGFGTFSITHRKERQGRNPATNKPMTIPASKSVKFKPGKQLKDAVN